MFRSGHEACADLFAANSGPDIGVRMRKHGHAGRGAVPERGFLLVTRIIAGVAIGINANIVMPNLVEFAPVRTRGKFVASLAGFFGFGFVLAALIGFFVIPAFSGDWRVRPAHRRAADRARRAVAAQSARIPALSGRARTGGRGDDRARTPGEPGAYGQRRHPSRARILHCGRCGGAVAAAEPAAPARCAVPPAAAAPERADLRAVVLLQLRLLWIPGLPAHAAGAQGIVHQRELRLFHPGGDRPGHRLLPGRGALRTDRPQVDHRGLPRRCGPFRARARPGHQQRGRARVQHRDGAVPQRRIRPALHLHPGGVPDRDPGPRSPRCCSAPATRA